jgi:hypothetical protein
VHIHHCSVAHLLFSILALLLCPFLSRVAASVATAEGREGSIAIERKSRTSDRTGKGKKHTQRNLARCRSDTLARQTFREISSGNLRRGTPARTEIFSPEIRENWEHCGSVCVCVYMFVCMCVRSARDISALVLTKEAREIPAIDRPDDRRGKSASEKSVMDENASHIRYPRYVYRGTFIARPRAETCY